MPATCFGPICRVVFRLIFEQVECTIDNAYNLRNLVLEKLVKIIEYIIIETLDYNFKYGTFYNRF
jgi:hypothetical protein